MAGYGIPKGRVEQNESLEAAARREFEEETGIDLSSLSLQYLDGSAMVKNGKKIHTFIAVGSGNEKYISSNLIPEGHFRGGLPENSGGRYFTIEEALKIVHKNQLSLLNLFKSHTVLKSHL